MQSSWRKSPSKTQTPSRRRPPLRPSNDATTPAPLPTSTTKRVKKSSSKRRPRRASSSSSSRRASSRLPSKPPAVVRHTPTPQQENINATARNTNQTQPNPPSTPKPFASERIFEGVWQRPFVNVFKQLQVFHKREYYATEGDVSQHINRAIGKTVFRVRGTVSAANYVQLPASPKQSLALTGRYLYVQIRPMGRRTFSLHVDVEAAGQSRVLRLSFSNLFTSLHVTGRVIQIPCASLLSSASRWTVLAVDLASLLRGYAKQEYAAIRSIQFCANLHVCNVFTSHDPIEVESMPRGMPFPVPRGSSFESLYKWVWVYHDDEAAAKKARASSPHKAPKSPAPAVHGLSAEASEVSEPASRHPASPAAPSLLIPSESNERLRSRVMSRSSSAARRSRGKSQSGDGAAPTVLREQHLLGFGSADGKGKSGLNYNLQWHPDGESVVYSSDATIVQLQLASGQQRFLTGHSAPISTLTYSPNGRLLASAQSDAEQAMPFICVWRDSRCVAHLAKHAGDIHALSFSADNRLLAAVGRDKQKRALIVVWDVSALLHEEPGQVPVVAKQLSEFDIQDLCFVPFFTSGASADFYQLVSCGRGSVRFWRVKNGHLPARSLGLGEHGRDLTFTSLAFESQLGSSGDVFEKRLYVGADNGSLFQVNFHARLLECIYVLHDAAVRCLCVSESFCVTGSDDRFLRVWPLDFSDTYVQAQHSGSIRAAAISPDGLRVAVGTENGCLGVLDLPSTEYSTHLRAHTADVTSVALDPHPDRTQMTTASEDGTIRVWELRDAAVPEQVCEFRASGATCLSLAYAPAADGSDAHVIASGFDTGVVRICDIPSSSVLHERHQHVGAVVQLAYSAVVDSRRLLFSLSDQGRVCVFDTGDDYRAMCMFSTLSPAAGAAPFLVGAASRSQPQAQAVPKVAQAASAPSDEHKPVLAVSGSTGAPLVAALVREARGINNSGDGLRVAIYDARGTFTSPLTSFALAAASTEARVVSLEFVREATELLCISSDGRITRYAVATGQLVHQSVFARDRQHVASPATATMSTNGNFVFVGTSNGRVLAAPTNEHSVPMRMQELPTQQGQQPVRSVSFAGTQIACASGAGINLYGFVGDDSAAPVPAFPSLQLDMEVGAALASDADPVAVPEVNIEEVLLTPRDSSPEPAPMMNDSMLVPTDVSAVSLQPNIGTPMRDDSSQLGSLTPTPLDLRRRMHGIGSPMLSARGSIAGDSAPEEDPEPTPIVSLFRARRIVRVQDAGPSAPAAAAAVAQLEESVPPAQVFGYAGLARNNVAWVSSAPTPVTLSLSGSPRSVMPEPAIIYSAGNVLVLDALGRDHESGVGSPLPRRQRVIGQHVRDISTIAVSSTSELVATGSSSADEDAVVNLWSIASGRKSVALRYPKPAEPQELPSYALGVQALAFSPRSVTPAAEPLLASLTCDLDAHSSHLCLWAWRDAQLTACVSIMELCTSVFWLHGAPFAPVLQSYGSNAVVTVGEASLFMWPADEQGEIQGVVELVALHASGDGAAAGAAEDEESAALESVPRLAQGEVFTCATLSRVNPHIMAGTSHGSVYVFLVGTDQGEIYCRTLGKWRASEYEVTCVHAVGAGIVTGDANGTLATWRFDALAGRAVLADEQQLDGAITASSLHSRAPVGAVGTAFGTLWFVDCRDSSDAQQTTRLASGHSDSVAQIAFDSKSGDFLASCGFDGSLRLWHVSMGQQVLHLELAGNGGAACLSLDFDPHAMRCVAGYSDGAVRLVGLGTMAVEGKCTPSPLTNDVVQTVAFVNHGRSFLVGCLSGLILEVQAADMQTRVQIEQHKGAAVSSIRVQHGGRGCFWLAVDATGHLSVWASQHAGTLSDAPTMLPRTNAAVTHSLAAAVDVSARVSGVGGFERETPCLAEFSPVESDTVIVVSAVAADAPLQVMFYNIRLRQWLPQTLQTSPVIKSLSSFAVSRNGARIAIGGLDGAVVLLDMTAKKRKTAAASAVAASRLNLLGDVFAEPAISSETRLLYKHQQAVSSLVFSATGNLASAGHATVMIHELSA